MSEARALMLFVLVLGPAAGALLAWMPRDMSALRLLTLALVMAFAIVFGETFRPAQQALREQSSTRLRIWVQSFAAGLVLLSVAFAAAAPRPALLERQTLLVLGIQLAFLVVPDLGVGRLPALASALALAILAAFRGGGVAVLAVTSYTLGLVAFLVLDHFAARLALRPAAVPALRATVFAEILRFLAPVALTLALCFALFPPRPHVWLGQATIDALEREKMAPAYLQLAFFALVGAMVVHYASRLLRSRREGKPPVTELLAAERAGEELIVERPPRQRPHYAGARGAIVRAYVGFLDAAGGRVLVRRPDQTPGEIASQLAAAGAPLQQLTALFARARYGKGEPSDADALQAESLGGALAAWLQSRRESGNAATGRHSSTSPSVRTT